MEESAFYENIVEFIRTWPINEAAELSQDLGISMEDLYHRHVSDLDPDQIKTLATSLRVSSDLLLFGSTEDVICQVITSRRKDRESEEKPASAHTGLTTSDVDELDVVIDKLSLLESAVDGIGLDGDEASRRGASLLMMEIIAKLQSIRAKM